MGTLRTTNIQTLKSIQHLTRNQVDTTKWDQCVQAAPNGLIYSHSFFLDQMSPGWEALVKGDYESVMPLTWSRKYGFSYLHQPFCAAQSGVAGAAGQGTLVDEFLEAIPARFRLVDILLQESNTPVRYAAYCKKRVNQLVNLSLDYATIRSGYHRLAKRMISRATEAGLVVEKNAVVGNSISFYRQHYGNTVEGNNKDYSRLISMFEAAGAQHKVLSLAVKKDHRLLGIYILLYDHRAVYSVIGGSAAEGKQYGAFYLLTDHAIQHFAGSGRIFRFEGSDIAGIAQFNNQFGARPVSYQRIKINRLPFPISLLK